MNILVCVKRVPATGGRIVLTPDGSDIDTRFLGFTVSPHEECAVEEAVRIVEAIRAQEASGAPFDLILFGNESADSGGFQVGLRVAAALGRPCVTGVKALRIRDGSVTARREAAGGGWESFELPLPAVITVKEGINLPRYPSVPGRLRAKKKEIERSTPEWRAGGLEKIGALGR